MPRRLAPLLVAVLLLLCGRARAETGPLTVLAASSLTESLQRVGRAWEARGNGALTFSFDASSRLARQVEAGVPADSFFSADREWMDWLEAKGLLAPGSRRVLLGNAIVTIVPASAAFVPSSAADLAKPEIRRIALAGDNVPAGRYARAALRASGAWNAVKDRVVSGDNVRATLAWVSAGEADAGVVYATDARVDPHVKVAFTFPSDSHPPIVYPAAALAGGHVDDAEAFLTFCQSPEARAIFAAAGFTPAP